MRVVSRVRSGGGQRELAADVEQDVGLAGRHRRRVGRADRLVVEVEPLLLVDGERGVVARPGPGDTKKRHLN